MVILKLLSRKLLKKIVYCSRVSKNLINIKMNMWFIWHNAIQPGFKNNHTYYLKFFLHIMNCDLHLPVNLPWPIHIQLPLKNFLQSRDSPVGLRKLTLSWGLECKGVKSTSVHQCEQKSSVLSDGWKENHICWYVLKQICSLKINQ